MSLEGGFYWDWQAWRGDSGIKQLSLEARGLWFEMLGHMRNVDKYGVLVGWNGERLSISALAKLVNSDETKVRKCIEELEWHGVFSRTEEGTIYCRRMIREKEDKRGTNTTLNKIMDYGTKIKAPQSLCRRFYDYYNKMDWHNKAGKEIDWRETLRQWFAKSQEPTKPSEINSCYSPPVEFEDSVRDAMMVLNHARRESTAVLSVALATYSKETIMKTLGAINDKELTDRVKQIYVDRSKE